MSIYIKDMKIPKVGVYTCELDVLGENTAVLTIYTPIDEPQRSYKLIPLPEGHGRLVDAELVKEILKPVDSISHYEPEWTWGELHEINCVAIDNAPTIVPAERSET